MNSLIIMSLNVLYNFVSLFDQLGSDRAAIAKNLFVEMLRRMLMGMENANAHTCKPWLISFIADSQQESMHVARVCV